MKNHLHHWSALVLVLLLSNFLQAQKKTDLADVTWGEELKLSKTGYLSEVFAEDDGNTFSVVDFKKGVNVQKLSPDFRVIYSVPMDMKLDKKALTRESITLVDDRILLLASIFDKKQETNTLYMRSFSAADMRPLSGFTKLAVVGGGSKRNQGGYWVVSSPNGQKVLVGVEKPNEKGGRETFGVKVFDKEMNEEWSTDLTLPYADDEFVRSRHYVDNDGSVMILGVKYPEKAESKQRRRADLAAYDHHVLVYKAGSDLPEDYLLTPPTRRLEEIVIALDNNNGDIICAGLYGDKNTVGIKGPFQFTFDRDSKQIVNEHYGVFDKEFITMYMTEKEEKKAEKQAKKQDKDLGADINYRLHEIIFKEDGGALLVAEQYQFYVSTVCTNTQNGGQSCRTIYHYVYNDIIVVSLAKDGSIEWNAKVPKRQHSVDDGGRYSSYALHVKGDKAYFIFNDNGENLFLKPGERVKQFAVKSKSSMVTLATVDAGGRTTREALLTPERREAILRPKDCVSLNDEQMLIYGSFKNNARYGKVQFQ